MIYHQTVKKVTEDYENLAFNTAISQMMIFINEVYRVNKLPREYAEGFVKMISCIIPHVGEEMWEKLGHNSTIAYEPWPKCDEAKLVKKEMTLAVQVNGKVRDTIVVSVDANEEAIRNAALSAPNVIKHTTGLTIRKVIVIKNKIVSVVAN